MKATLLRYMGDDNTVVDAARVSHAKTAERYSPNRNADLIRHLAEHDHWTPFGHPHASFHIEAPIFVARQLVKHQVGLVWNEVSRRYVDDTPRFWAPEEWRERAENVKQGSGGPLASQLNSDVTYQRAIRAALFAYNELLHEGVCPEQARAVLPLATYTEWHWTGSLAAWARVCRLRLDPHAQAETAVIARQISDALAPLFPVSWPVLMDGADNA